MLEITPTLHIDEHKLHFEYIRASGPGGQNVNKVSTAVQLRFDVIGSTLPAHVKHRLAKIAGKKLTDEGILILEAKRFRAQEQNREDAVRRFVELVRRATIKPKARIMTIPTMASREKRLRAKKQRGHIKRNRQSRTNNE